MSDIDEIVIFKKQLGLNLEVDQRFVGLRMKENKVLVFNFTGPEKLKDEVEKYFSKFKMQIKDFLRRYFTEKTIDGVDVYYFSVYLQELEKEPIPGEEEGCEECSGCGFH